MTGCAGNRPARSAEHDAGEERLIPLSAAASRAEIRERTPSDAAVVLETQGFARFSFVPDS